MCGKKKVSEAIILSSWGNIPHSGVHTLLQIPSWVIYFLDSGGGTYPELVYPDQITWFNQTASDITQIYGPIPALAFFHIPRFASLFLAPPLPNIPSLSLQSILGG